jgi:putative endonuclease
VKYKIYILFSETFKRTYVGFSEDPSKRLEAHNSGKVISTKKYMPLRIVYLEEFNPFYSFGKPSE